MESHWVHKPHLRANRAVDGQQKINLMDKRLVEMGEIQNPVPFSPINIADPKTITKNKNKIK